MFEASRIGSTAGRGYETLVSQLAYALAAILELFPNVEPYLAAKMATAIRLADASD